MLSGSDLTDEEEEQGEEDGWGASAWRARLPEAAAGVAGQATRADVWAAPEGSAAYEPPGRDREAESESESEGEADAAGRSPGVTTPEPDAASALRSFGAGGGMPSAPAAEAGSALWGAAALGAGAPDAEARADSGSELTEEEGAAEAADEGDGRTGLPTEAAARAEYAAEDSARTDADRAASFRPISREAGTSDAGDAAAAEPEAAGAASYGEERHLGAYAPPGSAEPWAAAQAPTAAVAPVDAFSARVSEGSGEEEPAGASAASSPLGAPEPERAGETDLGEGSAQVEALDASRAAESPAQGLRRQIEALEDEMQEKVDADDFEGAAQIDAQLEALRDQLAQASH